MNKYSMHCKDTISKILKQVFPEKELRGLSYNFHNHASVSYLYIPTISQTHEFENWN